MKEDIRWIQRLDSYKKALSQLKKAVELAKERPLTELEKQGLIQSFEFTHELSWKILKDFLEDRGNREIYGSKDTIREAFQYGLIEDGDVWMDMIKSRNETSHTYNEKTVEKIMESILGQYFFAFNALLLKLSELEQSENS
jgi:nucleotidyltransferase substrate binding protein (TIGR01987 family)